jgi:hypothetical protein
MMVVVPILSLQAMPEGEPSDIPTGIASWGLIGLKVAHAIDEALAVKCEYETESA